MKSTWTKAEVLQLVADWRGERDPVAEGWSYASLMAMIIEQWAPRVPETEIVKGTV